MLHPSARRAAALALSLALLLPAAAIAAPAVDRDGGPLAWATAAWQQLLAFFAPSEGAPPDPTGGSDYGPAIDPDGLQASDPATDSDLGPGIDPHGLQNDDSNESDYGPTMDPNG